MPLVATSKHNVAICFGGYQFIFSRRWIHRQSPLLPALR